MKNIRYYAFPSSAEDALKILLNRKYKAMVMAGGTLVSKTLPDSVETYLDIKNVPIKEIKVSGGKLVIGAGATFDEIDKSPLCREWAGGIISDAASKCSSQLIRNMATIGGNIARPHSFNIFPVILLGMDAEITVMTHSGKKTLPFAELYSDKTLKPGINCIITQISFSKKTKELKCEFIKLAKTHSSWESYVNLFFALNGKEARFVVGALTPRPFRAEAAEKSAAKNAPVQETLQKFVENLTAVKAGEYKTDAAVNLLKRYLGAE